MKSTTKSIKYKAELRSDIFITGIDVNTAYGGLADLISNMKESEKGKFVKKLFVLKVVE
jgi:hypothetical protein